MKSTNALLLILFVSLIFVSCSTQNIEKQLLGSWQLIPTKAEVNSSEYADYSRVIVFEKDQSFETTVTANNELPRNYNMGKYYVLSDSCIVTIHANAEGKLSPFSNMYKVAIKNDTLHINGFYLMPNGLNRILNPSLIDEYWVKMEK